jgi:hypothetical protein
MSEERETFKFKRFNPAVPNTTTTAIDTTAAAAAAGASFGQFAQQPQKQLSQAVSDDGCCDDSSSVLVTNMLVASGGGAGCGSVDSSSGSTELCSSATSPQLPRQVSSYHVVLSARMQCFLQLSFNQR